MEFLVNRKVWLFTTFIISLLLLPVLISSAQENAGDTTHAALKGHISGVLLLKSETRPTDLADAIKVIDYGKFQWAIFPAGSRATQRPDATDYTFWLGGNIINTAEGAPLESVWGEARADTKNLQLVQLIGPSKAEWRNALEAAGLEIVQYIYPFTYVVYGSQAAVDGISSAEFVRWQHSFDTGFRVLPQYRTITDRAAQPHRLVIYQGADRGALEAELTTLTGSPVQFETLNQTWAATNLNLTTETLAQAARLSGVFTIQPIPTNGGLRGEMSNQFIARNLNGSGVIQPGYAAWLAAVGVNGNGVIVADVDGGVQNNHPNLVSRLLPCTGSTCGGNATDSHGTHTAGIIAADGSSNVMLNGFQRGLGVAPGANLIEQLYSPTFTQAGGMLKLMQQSVQNNAVISANSWGPAGTPRGYDNDTMQTDIGVRDADSATAGNQPLTYVLSFMNGYGGISSQGSPDEAKNLFTIGSTNMQSSSNGAQLSNLFSLSANSAHGPALDGRTIPHMVAPGCSVDSTVSGSSYGFKCGTSMASPHVSGGAALFFEKFRTQRGVDPSPAMVKAAFTVIADSLAGNQDADGGTLGNPFDSKQGWGAFNLSAVISPTYPSLYVDQTQ
ncbi:MAG TPA: hypothetical protein ENJ56_09140, partial [Anaerolineae bacterium]|nr:hypothetical protein [Anaerolineae bacterium]